MINDVGCLIIHGFGGSFEEVKYLANYLKLKGYNVLCPSLKGHTGLKKDLIGVTYTDWIKSAEEGLIRLKEASQKVFVIGFSMGGLIGVNLCENHDIDGLVTLNTPIYYWDIKNILKNIMMDIRTRSFENIKRYIASSIKFPMSALYNFRKILSITKPKINETKCPIFIVQGEDDDTVQKISAKYIFDEIGSQKKKLKYYENSGHLILASPAAKEVSRDVENFFCSILKDEL